MQTFLPYPSFYASATCLDRQRLGKQRVEVKQILRALRGESRGYTKHPATLMWKGYEWQLALYGTVVCDAWISRGYRDSLRSYFYDIAYDMRSDTGMPPWFDNDAFHASHRSNLLRKDPAHYGQFGWTESPDLPYVWPVVSTR